MTKWQTLTDKDMLTATGMCTFIICKMDVETPFNNLQMDVKKPLYHQRIVSISCKSVTMK